MGTSRSVAIIIPAHDEESTLPRTLASLLAQDFEAVMNIVIVANGCSHQTVIVAEEHRTALEAAGHTLHVLALPQRGKCRAINAAEESLPAGPRIYLDADVRLSTDAVRAMMTAIASGTHLCSPRPRVVPSRTRLMRMYGRVWESLPIVRGGVIGGGVLAVSETGRTRWAQLPEITADDYFIESHFTRGERSIAADSWFEVVFPERWSEMALIRARWRRGKRELDVMMGAARPPRRSSGFVRHIAPRPHLWVGAGGVCTHQSCGPIHGLAKRRGRSVGVGAAAASKAVKRPAGALIHSIGREESRLPLNFFGPRLH